jgi:transposase
MPACPTTRCTCFTDGFCTSSVEKFQEYPTHSSLSLASRKFRRRLIRSVGAIKASRALSVRALPDENGPRKTVWARFVAPRAPTHLSSDGFKQVNTVKDLKNS